MTPVRFDRSELPPLRVGSRLERLRAALAGVDASGTEGTGLDGAGTDGAGLDGLLLTDLVSIRWLTGFTGSNAMVLVTAEAVLFATDGRYGEQAGEQLAAHGLDATIEVFTRRADQQRLVSAAAGGLGGLGLEADAVAWAEQRSFSSEWFPEATLVPTTGLLAQLRRLKDDAEVARIEAAARIADAALEDVLSLLADSPTEREFATELERGMVERGADGPSFPTICASGPNSARPHAEPGDRTVGSGDLVVLDFGALVHGYHSDMTRTLVVGEPSSDQLRLLEAATVAQARGAAAVRPGATAHDVDRACRDALAERGLEDLLVHGTGHGVGLEIHEVPILRPGAEEVLSVGEVVTVEPGVYLPGTGGARVEDTVVVTPDGARPLTCYAKDAAVAEPTIP